MSAPVVVITGATRGIGAAAAVELARRGAEVAIVGREAERVRAVAEEARAAGSAPVHEHVADLLRVSEVRRLAAELLETHPRIDVLANNAGAMFTSRQVTEDGFERTFALNHMAPFLLTDLLRERLAGGRVVTTASDAHASGQLDLDDLQFERRPFRAMRVYGTSKLMNILFTRELAQRAPELSASCFHPGVVRTGFGKNDGLMYKIGLTVAGPFLRTPAKGARSLVWLALDADPAQVDGAYVEDEKVATPSAAARDDVLAAGLWERTTERLGARDSGR
ncbi:MAG TPA: SDR family NAD(P)-dependent oxidoreductase [Baekduia sp.]|uniref:SDR family NAD(P)-dependent oxidoreductase n=1 Tax=Baekduia sp. TaxID=2600305 RepID=UPI002D7834B2|nr:SDR family NAD(P)-dependent oxidoreductase [Baekduia sp.]HET6508643.1 SDR family NAD(P)-dependent oxidoreductase [Baekduia sp.]